MNTTIIMMGSNTNAKLNIELATSKIVEYYELISSSFQVITIPFGAQFSANFHNIALKLFSNETIEETIAVFKLIEMEMGRKSDSKSSGIIPIDIDLIFWNNILIHEDYKKYEYVRNCVDEIK